MNPNRENSTSKKQTRGRAASCLLAVLGALLYLSVLLPMCHTAASLARRERRVAAASPLPPRVETPAPAGLLDINTVDAKALQALPGIGKGLSQAIVDFRQAQGGFHFIEDLLAVPGIGAKRLEAVRDLITLSPPHPGPSPTPRIYR